MSERCPDCDCPKARRADGVLYRGGEGEHLCWGGMCPQVDWRARALAAEEKLAMTSEFKVGDWMALEWVDEGKAQRLLGRVRDVVGVAREQRVVFTTPNGETLSVQAMFCIHAEHPGDPLARFASLIADAETCSVDGAATEQAKCIAALATALRESETAREEMKRTLRSIVEMAR